MERYKTKHSNSLSRPFALAVVHVIVTVFGQHPLVSFSDTSPLLVHAPPPDIASDHLLSLLFDMLELQITSQALEATRHIEALPLFINHRYLSLRRSFFATTSRINVTMLDPSISLRCRLLSPSRAYCTSLPSQFSSGRFKGGDLDVL